MSTGGGKMLANRRADRRVLHFRDADAWMAYNDRFGAADPFRSTAWSAAAGTNASHPCRPAAARCWPTGARIAAC
ncbi:hypothetical protein CNY89_28190, partial [Amaricoccus sp. HAR-UPW-R2A-40]